MIVKAKNRTAGKGRASGERRAPRPRNGFLPHLERFEELIEPEDLPEHDGKQRILIYEDVSDWLNFIPARALADTTPRRSLPPNSPRWAISFAHLNRGADRPLLPWRNGTRVNRRLWSQTLTSTQYRGAVLRAD